MHRENDMVCEVVQQNMDFHRITCIIGVEVLVVTTTSVTYHVTPTTNRHLATTCRVVARRYIDLGTPQLVLLGSDRDLIKTDWSLQAAKTRNLRIRIPTCQGREAGD